MPSLTRVGLLGYKALLHLYPRAFQQQFTSDMLRDFQDRGLDASVDRGWKGEAAHMWQAYTDIALSLARERGSGRGALIGALSVCATAILFFAPIWPPLPDVPRPPARAISADEFTAVLLVLGLFLLVALVIGVTCGVVNPMLQRRRNPPVRSASGRGLL
jgi:hypothetical protein